MVVVADLSVAVTLAAVQASGASAGPTAGRTVAVRGTQRARQLEAGANTP
jgi:hypothetical protein